MCVYDLTIWLDSSMLCNRLAIWYDVFHCVAPQETIRKPLMLNHSNYLKAIFPANVSWKLIPETALNVPMPLHPPFFVLFVAPFSDTPWLDCHATLLVNLLKDWLFCNPKFIPLYQCNSVADSIPVADPLSLHSWQGETQFCCSNQLNLYILSVKQVKLLFWF